MLCADHESWKLHAVVSSAQSQKRFSGIKKKETGNSNIKYHKNHKRLSSESRFLNAVMSFGGKADESIQGQVVCVDGGRLKRCGKSNRSEAPSDGYRSDSSGKLYAFPTQRSSGSVREALRLPRPPGLRNAKIFSHLFRCPPSTHTT